MLNSDILSTQVLHWISLSNNGILSSYLDPVLLLTAPLWWPPDAALVVPRLADPLCFDFPPWSKEREREREREGGGGGGVDKNIANYPCQSIPFLFRAFCKVSQIIPQDHNFTSLLIIANGTHRAKLLALFDPSLSSNNNNNNKKLMPFHFIETSEGYKHTCTHINQKLNFMPLLQVLWHQLRQGTYLVLCVE